VARCDLKVVLDGVDDQLRAGETVTGRVEVETDQAVTVDPLTVELAWRTHGRAKPVSGTAAGVTLFEGEITGQRFYTFELPVPAGPYTYHGRHLNVDWTVRARADIPWKLDPKAEAPVAVLPARRDDEAAPEPIQSPEPAPEGVSSIAPDPRPRPALPPAASPRALVGRGCISLPFLLPGLAMSWFGLSAVFRHWFGDGAGELDGNMVVLSFMGPPFALAGAILLFAAYSKWRSARRMGDVTLELDRHQVRRGETVEWRLALTPKRQLDLLAVKGWVEAEEGTTRGTGTDRSTLRHPLVKHEMTLSPARRLLAGEPFEVRGSFQIPDDAPLSFGVPNNAVAWTVHCVVMVDLATGWDGFQRFAVIG
jgi:hypothetical protein